MHHHDVDNYIAIPVTGGYRFRMVAELIYCTASGNYTWLHFEDGTKYLLTRTLKTLEERLPAQLFIRIHHHSLVNKMHIMQYTNAGVNTVRMINGEELEVSRRNQRKLREEFITL